MSTSPQERDGDDEFAALYERNKLHRIERSDGAEAYGVEVDSIETPALPGEVAVARDADAIIDALAADLFVQAANCVRVFGDFHLALSGDPALEPVYERLMYDPNFRGLPWQRTHLWMVAERMVSFDDRASCFRVVRETIVDHSDIPPEQVHPIFPLGETPAASYATHLREVLAWREKGQDRLDFSLVSMAPDGGVAGWAPGSPIIAGRGDGDTELVALDPRRGRGDPGVIAMTPTLVNASRFIAVHVNGDACRVALDRVVEGHDSAERLPVKALHPTGGTLKWYLGPMSDSA